MDVPLDQSFQLDSSEEEEFLLSEKGDDEAAAAAAATLLTLDEDEDEVEVGDEDEVVPGLAETENENGEQDSAGGESPADDRWASRDLTAAQVRVPALRRKALRNAARIPRALSPFNAFVRELARSHGNVTEGEELTDATAKPTPRRSKRHVSSRIAKDRCQKSATDAGPIGQEEGTGRPAGKWLMAEAVRRWKQLGTEERAPYRAEAEADEVARDRYVAGRRAPIREVMDERLHPTSEQHQYLVRWRAQPSEPTWELAWMVWRAVPTLAEEFEREQYALELEVRALLREKCDRLAQLSLLIAEPYRSRADKTEQQRGHDHEHGYVTDDAAEQVQLTQAEHAKQVQHSRVLLRRLKLQVDALHTQSDVRARIRALGLLDELASDGSGLLSPSRSKSRKRSRSASGRTPARRAPPSSRATSQTPRGRSRARRRTPNDTTRASSSSTPSTQQQQKKASTKRARNTPTRTRPSPSSSASSASASTSASSSSSSFAVASPRRSCDRSSSPEPESSPARPSRSGTLTRQAQSRQGSRSVSTVSPAASDDNEYETHNYSEVDTLHPGAEPVSERRRSTRLAAASQADASQEHAPGGSVLVGVPVTPSKRVRVGAAECARAISRTPAGRSSTHRHAIESNRCTPAQLRRRRQSAGDKQRIDTSARFAEWFSYAYI
jgi:hypothetical protein